MTVQNALGDLALNATVASTNTKLDALLTEVSQKLEAGQAVALDAGTLAALESISVTLDAAALAALETIGLDSATVTALQTVSLSAGTLSALETITVGLDAAALAALESISATVSNWPADYPNTALAALVTSTNSKLDALQTELGQKLEPGGSVSVSNHPSNFPDTVTAAKLDTIKADTDKLWDIESLLNAPIDSTYGHGKMVVGTVQGTVSSNFMGTFPQDGFSVASTGSGQSVSVGGVLNGARWMAISTGTTINAETIIEQSQLVSLPTRLIVQVSASQRIVNQELFVELVGCDDAGVVAEDGTGPLDYVALKWDGTGASNAQVSTRSGGGSVFNQAQAAYGTTAATGTTPNFIPATTMDLVVYPERIVASGFAVNALTAAGATTGTTINLPDPTGLYKLRIRAKNLGVAPASTTDWRVHQVRLLDQARVTAELTGGVGRAADLQSSIPVTGTVNLGTAVVDTELPAAAAMSDTLANPTTPQIASAALIYNGSTWERNRGNVSFTDTTSAARTTSGNGTANVNMNSRGAFVGVLVTAASGTSPTLVCKIQWSPDAGTTWVDLDATNAATGTITTTGTYTIRVYPGLTTSAAGVLNSPMPRSWRTVWTIGGTTPSFTFSIMANHIL